MKTWDGRHSIEKIDVTVVYFVPSDVEPLKDWQARANYFCRRIEQFHAREYGGQSSLTASLLPEPLISDMSTEALREGDGDAIFFRTLRETDQRLQFATETHGSFPILLVLSEINWRPLDDFYRLKPIGEGFEFEGQLIDNQHFPGARSGGARATYLANEGKGWGLVSADGWRVPYRGSDCVVYHEGVGHTVGLPHPEPGNGSVMSFGQYQGWLSESWLDKEQKLRMGWNPDLPVPENPQLDLFTTFRALPDPLVPQPHETVKLVLDWPDNVGVTSCNVQIQTDVRGPWVQVATGSGTELDFIEIGQFDRPTPVSYRVDATVADGRTAELWGYFQVRATQNENPQLIPIANPPSIFSQPKWSSQRDSSNDILKQLKVDKHWQNGKWTLDDQQRLISPKEFGAKFEFPGEVPRHYRLVIVAEPLDAPNGLIIGSKMGNSRFVTLCNYVPDKDSLSALENIEGRNVGNETTTTRPVFEINQLSQIVVTVAGQRVTVVVDGETLIDWTGRPEQLSLSDYWQTPNPSALFLGTYDCSYRFHRVTLTELTTDSDR